MIKDVRLGNDLEQPCLVRLQKVGTSSNGKAYARGLLEDNSGTLPFICFEAGPINRLRTMEGPTPFIIGGRVDANKYASPMGGQNLQVIVQKLFLPMGKPIYPCCCLQDPSTLSPWKWNFRPSSGASRMNRFSVWSSRCFLGSGMNGFLGIRQECGFIMRTSAVCCIIRFVWPAWLLAWARPSVGWTLTHPCWSPSARYR